MNVKQTRIKSRRKAVISRTGVSLDSVYCRKCMSDRKPADFMSALDERLDRNGYFSVCKSCVNETFEEIYASEKNLEITVLRMCRMLNVKYSEEAIQATLKQLETMKNKGNLDTPFFGLYRMKLVTTQSGKIGDRHEDLTYQEVTNINVPERDALHDGQVSQEVLEFWGGEYAYSEYVWFEKMLSQWKKTHKHDTMAEETLLKEIVFKQYDIEKARKDKGKSTATLVKELQDIMKTAAIDPSKTSIANSGRSHDTFSSFIKVIEENEPAEYYKDKALFQDYDNIEFYFEKYVLRPLKNFILGSRDFNVKDENELEEDSGFIDDVPVGEDSLDSLTIDIAEE